MLWAVYLVKLLTVECFPYDAAFKTAGHDRRRKKKSSSNIYTFIYIYKVSGGICQDLDGTFIVIRTRLILNKTRLDLFLTV